MSDPTLTVAATVLRDGIARVVHAMAPGDGRPILAGMLLRQHDDTVRLVAADNYRIAVMPLEEAALEGRWPDTVIPRDELKLVRAVLASVPKGDFVTLTTRDHRIRLETPAVVLEVGLIDGTFPDYEQAIPPTENRIVTLNARYLADIAKGISKDGSGTVTLRHSGEPLTPALFIDDHDGYLEVVMPVRTSADYTIPAERLGEGENPAGDEPEMVSPADITVGDVDGHDDPVPVAAADLA